MAFLFEVCLCHLEKIVRLRVILAQEVTRSLTFVFEEMKLREHQQSLHDHCLKSCFSEAKVKRCGEAGAGARGWSGGEHVGSGSAPIDQVIWSNCEYLELKFTVCFKDVDARDAVGVGIRVDPVANESTAIDVAIANGVGFHEVGDLSEFLFRHDLF